MAQHVFHTMLQSGARGWAAGTGALHAQPDNAVAEAAEDDIPTIPGHRRADAGIEQFLDLLDNLGIGGGEILRLLGFVKPDPKDLPPAPPRSPFDFPWAGN